MKISQKDAILVKNLSVKGVWCAKAVEWISGQGLETWKHWRESARWVWEPSSGRPHSAGSDDNIEKVENFVFSQEDKPKRTYQLVRFRMKLAFPAHRITHRHLQLKCFKPHPHFHIYFFWHIRGRGGGVPLPTPHPLETQCEHLGKLIVFFVGTYSWYFCHCTNIPLSLHNRKLSLHILCITSLYFMPWLLIH